MMKRKSKKAVRVPRPGSLAAFVVSRPIDESANDVARAARAANPEWRKTTWRKVYQMRWYYGLTERPRVAEVATTGARAAKPVVNVRLPAPVPARTVGPVDRGEFVQMLRRVGTDFAREAIRALETEHADAAVPARESA